MRLSAFFIFTAIFFASTVAGRNVPFSTEQKITGLYPPVSGVLSGKPVPESPDPLVAYRWTNPRASDGLESYLLTPVSVGIDRPENVKRIGKKTATIRVDGPCDLMFDFGRVSAGWLEFDSDDLDGEIEMSISEYTEPAVLNAGAQHPHKTAVPVRYGNTYRLELNTELYEGVRYGWIHVRSLRRPATISAVRLVCQTKPANYEGSFRCSDPTLTRIWYTGAYTVKLNLLKEYFGAILMERSDRHSWTGDAHPSQAASMVAFGNYDFVKQNLYYTSTQFNGIAGYSLYWVLSLIDYYNYTGDRQTLDSLTDNACKKLDVAYAHYGTNPDLQFHGWDERLGAGFENPNCDESQNTYKMLSIRAWNEFAAAMDACGRSDLAAKYRAYVDEKSRELRDAGGWYDSFGIFAASDAVNAGFTNSGERQGLWRTAFTDRQQRLSYSPFNQYFVIQAMARMGRYPEALTTIDDCWGGQLRYGGTTFFEVYRPSWNDALAPNGAPVNNQCGYTSFTHPWSAGVTKWLTEEILGVKPVLPGFGRFLIAPHLSERVASVEGCVPTLHGTIRVVFDIKTGKGRITVPDGTVAAVGIPKTGRVVRRVSFDGKEMPPAARQDDDFVYYEGIVAGDYRLRVEYDGALQPVPQEAFSYACSQPVVQDSLTRGDWKGKYGSRGYILCSYDGAGNDRVNLPDFTDSVVSAKIGARLIASETDDPRALASDRSGDPFRRLGAAVTLDPLPCNQTMTFDLYNNRNCPYRVALYFVDWEREGRRSAIEVFDLKDKRLLMPVRFVENYGEGRYVILQLDRPVRLRVDQVRGTNASLSGIFFD